MKIYLLGFVVFLIFTFPTFGQPTSAEKVIPFSNEFGLTLEVGGVIPNTDYESADIDISGRLLIEYFFGLSKVSSIGIRLSGTIGKLSGSDYSNEFAYPPVPPRYKTGYFSTGGGIVYSHTIGKMIPYLSFLVSGIFFNPLDEDGYKLPNNKYSVYSKDALLYTFETGLRFPFSENWSFNLSFNYNISDTDFLDDIKANSNNDAFFGLYTGISFYINFRKDTDNDGVNDDVDLCPNTPEGMIVNEFGCSSSDLESQKILYDSTKDHFLRNGIFSDGSLYCFQVEILKNRDEADSLKQKINDLGIHAYVLIFDIGGTIWYSVRIGYFSSFDAAEKYKNEYYRNLKSDR